MCFRRAGIERKGTLKPLDGTVAGIKREWLGQSGPASENAIHRVRPFHTAARFCDRQFEIEGGCDPAYDFILQCEEVANPAIEPLSPKMRVGFCVDQLRVDSHLVANPANASLEHIAHAQFTANLPRSDPLALIRECRVARDHHHVANTGKIGR